MAASSSITIIVRGGDRRREARGVTHPISVDVESRLSNHHRIANGGRWRLWRLRHAMRSMVSQCNGELNYSWRGDFRRNQWRKAPTWLTGSSPRRAGNDRARPRSAACCSIVVSVA